MVGYTTIDLADVPIITHGPYVVMRDRSRCLFPGKRYGVIILNVKLSSS
jgi:hypothetical protein